MKTKMKMLPNVLSAVLYSILIKLRLAGTVFTLVQLKNAYSTMFIMYQYPEGQSEYNNTLAGALFYYDSDRAV